jgi:condensation domain-containing protein
MQSFSTRGLTTPGEQAGPQPLSPAQEGLWFMQRLAPLSTAYHLARVFHLRGQADISALEQAFAAVVSTARESAAAGQDRLTDDMQSILAELMQ